MIIKLSLYSIHTGKTLLILKVGLRIHKKSANTCYLYCTKKTKGMTRYSRCVNHLKKEVE